MAEPAGEGEAAGLDVINFTRDQATRDRPEPRVHRGDLKFNRLPSELTLDS